MIRYSFQETAEPSKKEDNVFKLLDRLEQLMNQLIERLEDCKTSRLNRESKEAAV